MYGKDFRKGRKLWIVKTFKKSTLMNEAKNSNILVRYFKNKNAFYAHRFYIRLDLIDPWHAFKWQQIKFWKKTVGRSCAPWAENWFRIFKLIQKILYLIYHLKLLLEWWNSYIMLLSTGNWIFVFGNCRYVKLFVGL